MSDQPGVAAAAALSSKPVLSLATAQAALAGGVAAATEANGRFSIVVLDDGGHLLAFARMDGIHLGTIEVAIAKARTAIFFKRSTKAFGEALASSGTGLLSLPGVVTLEGGLPVAANGDVLGAIGVSGGTPDTDGRIAAAALDTLIRAIGQ